MYCFVKIFSLLLLSLCTVSFITQIGQVQCCICNNMDAINQYQYQYQQLFTVHTAMVYVIQICWQLASRIRTELCPDPARKLYNIYHCCVYSEKLLMVDRGTKHVEFYSKNKFEKLVHLVGFIIRIYHDAQLPEHQILF